MADEWDIFPDIRPPSPPFKFGGEVSGVDGRLSRKEIAAENKRFEELYKEERKDYERRLQEARRDWPHERIDLVKARIKLLRRWQRQPTTEDRRSMPGCVYLMWCPSLAAFKIGRTRNMHQRLAGLRQHVDPAIELCISYRTPVFLLLLETALHRHFRHFQFSSDKSKELFKLPHEEVEAFEATTAVIERLLLSVEILHLKHRLSKFEQELREIE
jgi:hypothetical protein